MRCLRLGPVVSPHPNPLPQGERETESRFALLGTALRGSDLAIYRVGLPFPHSASDNAGVTPANPSPGGTPVMHDSILQSIGRTPLIRLRRLAADVPPAVFIKVESLNPGGSVKDRVAV